MGRPKRSEDADLTAQMSAMVLRYGSVRQVAFALGMHPTTLARSLQTGAFGPVTRARIHARREDAEESLRAASKGDEKPAAATSSTLRKLREMTILLAGAVAELEAIEDRRLSRRKRLEPEE